MALPVSGRDIVTDMSEQVIGAQSRWVFDWFHWWFGLCLIIIIVEIIT